MPFGLKGAPATFQRFINWVLREYLDDFCSAYVDDVIIYSSGTYEDHMEKVELVLKKLLAAGLHLDPKKCEFAKKIIKYLSFIMEARGGIRTDPEKVQVIED